MDSIINDIDVDVGDVVAGTIVNPKDNSGERIDYTLNHLFKKSDCKYNAYMQDGKLTVISDSDIQIHTVCVCFSEKRNIGIEKSESFMTIKLYCHDRIYETITIDSDKLYQKSGYVKRFGAQPFVNFGDNEWELFFGIIRISLCDLEQENIYTYSGWTNGELIYGNYRIGDKRFTCINSTVSKYKLISVTDKSKACEFVKNIGEEIADDDFIGYSVICYYLLSLLKPRFCECNTAPSFALALIGITGSRKTTVASNLANPMAMNSCCFEDSAAAIRHDLKTTKAGCLIIDDFKNNSKPYNDKFEELLRLTGDITSTGKRMYDKDDNDYITAMTVITGEKIPTLQSSSYPRVLFLDIDADTINCDSLTNLQENIGTYISFVAHFIQYFIANKNITAIINKMCDIRNKVMQSVDFNGIHGRYCDMYAWLITVWEEFDEFMTNNNVCLTFDYKKRLHTAIINQHLRFENDPVHMFINAFFELMDSNSFIKVTGNYNDNIDFDILERDDKFFIVSGKVYSKICNFYKASGISFDFGERTLRKKLFENGFLERTNNKKLTSERKYKNNRSVSGYWLYKNNLENYGGKNYD